jgi:hypothetical protein
VIFAYQMPYSGSAVLNLTTPLLTEALVVMIPSGSVQLQNSLLRNEGLRNFQGTEVQLFSMENFSPNSALELVFSGERSGIATENRMTILPGSGEKLLLGTILLLVALGLLIPLIHRQRGNPILVGELFAPPPETEEALIDDILLLDDLFQDGKLDAVEYHQRRDQLKERLRALHTRTKGAG